MKKNQWMFGILLVVFCAMSVLAYPTQTKAASQSDQNAYRAVFDASYYYNAYPDVAAACGTDAEALFSHFVNYGVYEGRSCSAEFNPQAYKQRYADLQEAFGNDMAAYCRHYEVYGRAEGRNATVDGQAAVTVTVIIKPNEKKNAAAEETVSVKESGTTTTAAEKESSTTTTTEKESGTTTTAAEKESSTTTTAAEKESSTTTTAAKENNTSTAAEENTAATVTAKENTTVGASAQSVKGTIIGTYTTSYDPDILRATNVELAAQRINGVVVQPDGKFSFSSTILDRTEANGYVEGPIFVKGKEATGIGGGVCQVSSTLYAAMLEAGLPATERHAHSMPVDYMPQGMDATIAGNYLDLKFTNTFSQSLLIQATADNGTLTVTLVLQ